MQQQQAAMLNAMQRQARNGAANGQQFKAMLAAVQQRQQDNENLTTTLTEQLKALPGGADRTQINSLLSAIRKQQQKDAALATKLEWRMEKEFWRDSD
jgi:hypothetical protein